MKVKEINKRYTEIVMEYMNNGYYFNTTTMSGSQGEITHTDLTNGETIIRIVMDKFHDFERYTDGIEIIVGKCTDERVKPNTGDSWSTIWNNRLEIISSEKFYQIGRENRSGDKFYGTEEEANEAMKKVHERYEARRSSSKQEFSDNAKKIVLSFVKKQPKCKSVKLADIESVYKITSSNEYFVKAKGKTYKLR